MTETIKSALENGKPNSVSSKRLCGMIAFAVAIVLHITTAVVVLMVAKSDVSIAAELEQVQEGANALLMFAAAILGVGVFEKK